MEWAEADTAEAVWEAYRRERRGEARSRQQGLWLLRGGRSLREVAAAVGVEYRTVQRWVSWYRQGGVEEVRKRRGGGHGQPFWLTREQEAALVAEAAKGRLVTAEDARAWIAEEFGIQYRRAGIYGVLYRLQCWPMVPRPFHVQANPEAQAAWKRGVRGGTPGG